MHLNRTKAAISVSIGLALLLTLAIIFNSYSKYFSLPKEGHESICAHYDKSKRVIFVICNSTLPELYETIADERILKKETSDKVWFLNSSIFVSKGVVLTIKPDDVKWLKISSVGRSAMSREPLSPSKNFESTPYVIKALGKLDLQGIKITSWNPLINNYQKQNPNGAVPRPYIIVESGADPSNISSSEIAYLGYNSSRKQGLSFYGGDRSSLVGNKIHDLWYGFFSTNVSKMIIQNNSVYSNLRYGIDPHMLSHDMIIKENYIHNSRIGIICSLDCSNMLIESNRIENNKDIGLMLSRNTSNSTLRHNNISHSDIGLSVSESHSNKIYDNKILRSHDGLTIKNNSSNNMLINNTITYPIDCGILVSTGSHNNRIEWNYIQKYDKSGICLGKGASHNTFQSNQIDGRGLFGISVKDKAEENIFQDNVILIANNAIRIYNNSDTLFVNNKISNTYGHQYIVSGHSELNLADTRFLGDRVRFAGTDINTVKIWNSGIVDINTLRPGNNNTAISRYYTNIKPYFANLSSVTIKIYSLNK